MAPVLKQGHTTKDVYFPVGADWFEYPQGSKFHGGSRATVPAPLDKTPVFQRGGSVVARRMRVRRSSALMGAVSKGQHSLSLCCQHVLSTCVVNI